MPVIVDLFMSYQGFHFDTNFNSDNLAVRHNEGLTVACRVKMKTKLNTIPNLLRIPSAFLLLYEIFLLHYIQMNLLGYSSIRLLTI